MSEAMVGCENDQGTLNVHKETETCAVCVKFCSCLPYCAKQDVNGNCCACGKPIPPGTWAERFGE